MAIYAGIRQANDLGIRRIIIESDNATIINAINHIIKTPWEIAQLIEEIKSLKEDFESISFQHCYREANQAADFLAKSPLNCNIILGSYCYKFQNIIFSDDHGCL